MECCLEVAEGEDDPVSEAEKSEEEEEEEEEPELPAPEPHEEEEVLPIRDAVTSQVFLPDDRVNSIGRIKPMHEEDLRNAQLSVYCRYHQCTKLYRWKNAPATIDLLRWFKRGVEIGRGKDHRAEHMAMLP